MLVSRAQLGAAIAEARTKTGFTQLELAQRAGLEETTIIALEQGQYKPEPSELSRGSRGTRSGGTLNQSFCAGLLQAI